MIEEIIRSLGDIDDNSPVGLFTHLTSERMIPVGDDAAVWSIAGISRVFGVEVGEAIYQGMIAAGLRGVAARFASVGLDARSQHWLVYADQLAAAISQLTAIKDELKYIGYDRRSIWDADGDGTELTTEIVEAALQRIQLHDFANALVQRVEGAVRLAAQSNTATEQSLVDAALEELDG